MLVLHASDLGSIPGTAHGSTKLQYLNTKPRVSFELLDVTQKLRESKVQRASGVSYPDQDIKKVFII